MKARVKIVVELTDSSLSKFAAKVTGPSMNGYQFFRLEHGAPHGVKRWWTKPRPLLLDESNTPSYGEEA